MIFKDGGLRAAFPPGRVGNGFGQDSGSRFSLAVHHDQRDRLVRNRIIPGDEVVLALALDAFLVRDSPVQQESSLGTVHAYVLRRE